MVLCLRASAKILILYSSYDYSSQWLSSQRGIFFITHKVWKTNVHQMNQISSKSNTWVLRYQFYYIFKHAAICHLGSLKSQDFLADGVRKSEIHHCQIFNLSNSVNRPTLRRWQPSVHLNLTTIGGHLRKILSDLCLCAKLWSMQ